MRVLVPVGVRRLCEKEFLFVHDLLLKFQQNMSKSAIDITDHKTLRNVYVCTCNVQILQIFGYSDSMAITSSYIQNVKP